PEPDRRHRQHERRRQRQDQPPQPPDHQLRRRSARALLRPLLGADRHAPASVFARHPRQERELQEPRVDRWAEFLLLTRATMTDSTLASSHPRVRSRRAALALLLGSASALATAAPLAPTTAAPDFTLRTLDGQRLRLGEQRGR